MVPAALWALDTRHIVVRTAVSVLSKRGLLLLASLMTILAGTLATFSAFLADSLSWVSLNDLLGNGHIILLYSATLA